MALRSTTRCSRTTSMAYPSENADHTLLGATRCVTTRRASRCRPERLLSTTVASRVAPPISRSPTSPSSSLPGAADYQRSSGRIWARERAAAGRCPPRSTPQAPRGVEGLYRAGAKDLERCGSERSAQERAAEKRRGQLAEVAARTMKAEALGAEPFPEGTRADGARMGGIGSSVQLALRRWLVMPPVSVVALWPPCSSSRFRGHSHALRRRRVLPHQGRQS